MTVYGTQLAIISYTAIYSQLHANVLLGIDMYMALTSWSEVRRSVFLYVTPDDERWLWFDCREPIFCLVALGSSSLDDDSSFILEQTQEDDVMKRKMHLAASSKNTFALTR